LRCDGIVMCVGFHLNLVGVARLLGNYVMYNLQPVKKSHLMWAFLPFVAMI
jgi:hypothetical protein